MPQPPHLVTPEGFDDCQEIADRFLGGEVVMIDVVGLRREEARRIVDFSSGTCYTGGGRLQRIREHLYLLVPPGAEFDPPWDPDRSPLRPGGPSLAAAVAAPLPVEEWILADAVSAPRFDD